MKKFKKNLIYFVLLVVLISGLAGIIWQKDFFLPITTGTVYAVDCYDNEGTLLDTFSIRLNDNLEPMEDITFPTAPAINGYTFVSWSIESIDTVNYLINYKAIYSYSITINYYAMNGDLITTVNAIYNTLGNLVDGDLTAPDAPQIEGYIFNAWVEVENGYKASYIAILNYTFNFLEQGEPWETKSLSLAITDFNNPDIDVPPAPPVFDNFSFAGWEITSYDVDTRTFNYEANFSHNFTVTINDDFNGPADYDVTLYTFYWNIQFCDITNHYLIDYVDTANFGTQIMEGYIFDGFLINSINFEESTITCSAIWSAI